LRNITFLHGIKVESGLSKNNKKRKEKKPMTLIKWKNNPANVFDTFPAVPTLFNDFFEGMLNNDFMNREVMRYVPSVNIAERKNDFRIELAAPGYMREDLKIAHDNGVLTISSEKKDEKTNSDDRYTRKEFSFASFRRTFSLPEYVDAEKISAEYKDGLLTLTVPKKEEAKQKPAREIKIS
jgi:HSP20 family protein